MKYAITGHTSGIGKYVFDYLSPDIIGFSRSTGFNINISEDRQRIIKLSNDCDIFINNAQDDYGQSKLLIDLFRVWKDKDKIILNMGIAISSIKLPHNNLDLISYCNQKKALKSLVEDFQGARCKVLINSFSYIGTERILKKYSHFTENDYITVEQATKIIVNSIKK